MTSSGFTKIEPLSAPPDATVSLPGSKSITNRALLCAALASGTTVIEGALFADDTEAMADAVAVLGADVVADPAGESFTVTGVGGAPRPEPDAVVHARMSGTTGRFSVAVAAAAEVPVVIDGHPQLRARPFGDIVAAVRCLGARIDAADEAGLPLRVQGPMGPGPAAVSVDRSSQFLSGLMMAGPVVRGGLTLRLTTQLVSRPYVEMTAAVMRAFGAEVELSADQVSIAGSGYRSPGRYRVEPDASAAAYFWAAAAITGGTVGVAGLGMSSIQGDVAFVSVLAEMGAEVDSAPKAISGGPAACPAPADSQDPADSREVISVTGGALHGAGVDLGALSDTAPTLAVVAALAEGPTTVSGIGFIRGKESDRIAAPVAELRRCGVDALELPDGFIVAPTRGRPPTGARISTYEDHRIAMAFSVLGLAVPGIEIEAPGCVAKTFPGFFDTLSELR